MGRDFKEFLETSQKPCIVVGCGWGIAMTTWGGTGHNPEIDHPSKQYYTIDADARTEPDMTAPFLQADLRVGNGRIYEVVFEGLCAFDNSSGRPVKVRQPFSQLLQKAKSLLRNDGKIVFLSGSSDDVDEVQRICTGMGLRCERAKERKMVGRTSYIELTAKQGVDPLKGRNFEEFLDTSQKPCIVVGRGWRGTRHNPDIIEHPAEKYYTIDPDAGTKPDMTAPFLQADLRVGNGRIYKVVFEGLWALDNSSGRPVKVWQPFSQLLQKAKSLLRNDGKIVFLSCASNEVDEVQRICTGMGLRCERAKERKMVGSNPYIKLTASIG